MHCWDQICKFNERTRSIFYIGQMTKQSAFPSTNTRNLTCVAERWVAVLMDSAKCIYKNRWIWYGNDKVLHWHKSVYADNDPRNLLRFLLRSLGIFSEPMQRLHYPLPTTSLSNEHAQSFVLPWTAVGENGSVHARTAGKTFNDFGIFHDFKIVWSKFFIAQKTNKVVDFLVRAGRNVVSSLKFTRGVALEWLLTN